MIRRPLLWGWLGLLPFLLFPRLDLWSSGLFWDAADGFFLGKLALLEFIRKGLPPIIAGCVLYALLVAGAGRWLKQTFLGITPRLALFLLSSYALGPGLVVNTLFKDNWGRARPSQIIEFGGSATFSPVGWISDQCVSNCSFVSGHGAMGFWVTAFALLTPAPWRRTAWTIALAFGCLVGWVRIAQGGHFLSDVWAAAVITISLNILLWRIICRGRAWGEE